MIKAAMLKYRTVNPRIFGSVLHGLDEEGSDLDLLVDALPEIAAIHKDAATQAGRN
jgi:predicted nucleotidyltransferase